MLSSVFIQNFVLIEQLEISFSSQLGIMTGETGAGKSILLDALGLVMGNRGEAEMIRPGTDKASISASFKIADQHPLYALLTELDIDTSSIKEQGLIIKRSLARDGKSKAYVNDEPVTLKTLKLVTSQLIEIVGQFDNQGLFDSKTHLLLLDEFAGLKTQRAEVALAYAKWHDLQKDYTRLEQEAEQYAKDRDYLEFALSEFEKLDPQEAEEQILAEKRQTLQNQQKVVELIEGVEQILTAHNGVHAQLLKAQRQIDRQTESLKLDFGDVLTALDSAALQIDEAIKAIGQKRGAFFDAEIGSLDDIEERLFALKALARKHQVQLSDLPQLKIDLQKKFDLIENAKKILAEKQQEMKLAAAAYLKVATQLSAARREAAQRLERAILAELVPLKLEKARFVVEIGSFSDAAQFTKNGIDALIFKISTNPNHPLGELNKIASGGELSRILLALKVVMHQANSVDTLIFDEIDSGIGGAVADAVGVRLKKLSREVQTLIITHSPQIASFAFQHYKVEKIQSKDQLKTRVVALDDDRRIEELARMLSGAEITVEAIEAAKSLVLRAGSASA